ncbi:hypothetical protein ACJX0J_012053, partial [Zea mays]
MHSSVVIKPCTHVYEWQQKHKMHQLLDNEITHSTFLGTIEYGNVNHQICFKLLLLTFGMLSLDSIFITVEVLLYISINKNSDIISAGVMLQDAREARFNEGFPIFCITSHLKLLEDIGNKFNLIINLNVSIQKAK